MSNLEFYLTQQCLNTIMIIVIIVVKHNDCEMCDMYGIWSNDDVGTYYVNNNWDRVKRQRIQKNDKYSDILKLPCQLV